MRVLLFLFLIFSTRLSAQNNAMNLEARIAAEPTGHFVLTEKRNTEGQHIVRRMTEGMVIIRNQHLTRIAGEAYFEINDEWKWAETYPEKLYGRFYLNVEENPAEHLSKVKLIRFDADYRMAEIEGSVRQIRKEILSLQTITFIQKKSDAPSAESPLREYNLGINGLRFVHAALPSITGAGITASVKEAAFDPTDMDIQGRAFVDELSAGSTTNHATEMATLIGGAGNSFITGRGAADAVTLYSENFSNLFPAANAAFTGRGISVQNHSYGVGIENYYGLESVAYDNQAQELPSLFHVYSAGNSGSASGTGTYAGLPRYGTLTGSFKQAKNVLLVTSTNHTGEVLAANSAGPAYDGRIKPELSAFGNGGTSDAAALVSGAAVLIQDYWDAENGELPNADMVKAILIAGLDDMGAPGPDYYGGYGQLNLQKSMEIVSNDWWFEGSISMNETALHTIEVAEPVDHLTVVLTWRDPAAANGDAFALVNDLDLRATMNAEEWLPWALKTNPTIVDLSAEATRSIDRLNNVEVIRIDDPEVGTVELSIYGFDVNTSQTYSIAYYIEEKENFVWKYPTQIDPQVSSDDAIVYFHHTFDAPGTLQWADLSDTWTTIGTIQPGDTYHSVTWPDINSEVKLRALFGELSFESDIFRISPKPELLVALFCADELVLNWEPIQEGATYEVLYVANGQLNVLQTSADTFAIANRNDITSLNFTVRQVGDLANGRQDETLRVDFQATRCYLNNFLVSMDDLGEVEMLVDLSLPDRIQTLRILKVDQEDSVVLSALTPTLNSYIFSDTDLVPGLTTYYVQVITETGLEILSDPNDVFSTDDKKYILFPNPVTNGILNLLTPEPNAIFQILQLDGRILFDTQLSAEFETIPITLAKGTYLYRVIKNGRMLKSGKFAVGN